MSTELMTWDIIWEEETSKELEKLMKLSWMSKEDILVQINDWYERWWQLTREIRNEFESEDKLFNNQKKNKKKGKIKTEIDGPYTMDEIPTLIQYFGDGKHKGKVIVRMTNWNGIYRQTHQWSSAFLL